MNTNTKKLAVSISFVLAGSLSLIQNQMIGIVPVICGFTALVLDHFQSKAKQPAMLERDPRKTVVLEETLDLDTMRLVYSDPFVEPLKRG